MAGRDALLEWYRPRGSAYPWRRRSADAYAVLVSEMMLQQTQAARVAPAYEAFLARHPSVEALAKAPLREVLGAWSGLGYNRRAMALREAARQIVADHEGRIPADPQVLATLPGVGPYTAAAVASIAHGVPVPAVDTNVARVVSRFRLGVDGRDAPRRLLREAAAAWMNGADPGRWNQALMDLGREVCRPRPRCRECPLAPACRFRRSGRAPVAGPPRQQPFEGSMRQVRGTVVRALVERGGRSTLGGLRAATGEGLERLTSAVTALAAEGLVRAGPAALAGRPAGRVSLPA